MKGFRALHVAAICLALVLLGVASSGHDSVRAGGKRLPYRDSLGATRHKGIEVVLLDAFSYRPYEHAAALADTPTATFQVTFEGPWPPEAQAALQYAVSIWGNVLSSPVPIKIKATFTDLPGQTLGKAHAVVIHEDAPGAPVPATWYVDALADRLAGFDLFTGNPGEVVFDIEAEFDSLPAAAWYLGTDAHPPANTVDFVSVVLHELGHGLGFLGTAVVSGGQGFWGEEGLPGEFLPYIYDRFTRASGTPIIHFANGSTELANALTGGNLFFSSPVVAAGNHPAISTPAKLYAPSPWQQGSSYAHLDEAMYPPGNANALMTPMINTAEANHNPGPITSEIFTDLGWGPIGGGAPGQPTVTSAVASGGVLTVTWASGGGGAPTSHQLDFYVGATWVANVPSGPSTTANIPLPPGITGTFGVRVTASNSIGSSAPSAQFNFTIGGGGGAPGQPTVTSAGASGGVLTVTWLSGSGAAPTTHRLDFYSGGVLVAPITVGAGTTFVLSLPPGIAGTFGVRVTAFNGTVAGPASNEYAFTIAPACAVPAAPIVTGGIVGGNGSVNWQAVPGATSYVVSAGTAPGGVEYLAPTNVGSTLAVGASGLPPGFFAWVRVAAVNACSQQGPATDFLVQ